MLSGCGLCCWCNILPLKLLFNGASDVGCRACLKQCVALGMIQIGGFEHSDGTVYCPSITHNVTCSSLLKVIITSKQDIVCDFLRAIALQLSPLWKSSCICWSGCDVQIKHESFLEDINNILNSGDVPNIYPAEDLDSICTNNEIKGIVQDAGLQPTKTNLFSAYTKRVRSNIHCVITMR